jgi:hypothetical protein
MLRYLSTNPEVPNIGLHGPIIYDTFSDNIGLGIVSVNATRYTVTCGTVPNASVKQVQGPKSVGYLLDYGQVLFSSFDVMMGKTSRITYFFV